MLKIDEASSATVRSPQDTDYLLHCQGWCLFEGVVSSSQLATLRTDLDASYAKRRQIQVKNGIGAAMSGTAHHLLGDGNSLDTFMASLPLHDHIRQFFAAPYILNSFGAVLNQPNDSAYVGKIHRDVRTYSPNFRLMMNMLVMLDDFTAENGATHFLSGSHHAESPPQEDMFFRQAARAFGKAGDILLFDSRVWHAAGVNRSQSTRRGLTLTFTRAFYKQQIDFPRFLGEDYVGNASPDLRQVLGYDARMPASLDEFYQPPEKRTYKPGQG